MNPGFPIGDFLIPAHDIREKVDENADGYKVDDRLLSLYIRWHNSFIKWVHHLYNENDAISVPMQVLLIDELVTRIQNPFLNKLKK